MHYSSDKSPNAIFKICWDYINTAGYRNSGKRSPAFVKKSKPKKEEKSTGSGYRKGMGQREYEQWRESQGASRF